MHRRIQDSILATSLAAFIALPAVAADAGAPAGARPALEPMRSAATQVAGITGSGVPAMTLLPDERDEPLQLLTILGPALAIGILTIVGLTITLRGLRQDMRKRRMVYRPRRQ